MADSIQSSSSKTQKLPKPELSMATIINMSMGFMGIQMAFGLQNGNASRILSNFGADVGQLSWFWLVAPITGLLVQPLIGHFGDQTWTWLGRRKPYILVGAILCAIGLIFLPNAASVTHFFGANVLLLAVVFLALMDASVNVAMEPFRALVGDMLPKTQGTIGFSVQTILICIGAVIGSFLPWAMTNWFGVSNVAPEGFVADNVIWSFYLGAAILLLTIIYTIVTIKEYSPKEFELYSEDDKDVESIENKNLSAIWDDFKTMPNRMKKLGAVQFFSWFALFTMWVYTTSALATHHYGLLPSDSNSATFNKAGDWVGILFAIYNAVALAWAFVIPIFVKATSRKFVHAFSLVMGALGLFSMYFISNPELLWISMLGIGMAWASILALPYALLIDKLPLKKMGVYMGIFNFFIVIPQIINGIAGGPIVHNFFGDYAILYLCLGGVFFLIAAYFTIRVDEPLFGEYEYLQAQKEKAEKSVMR